MILKCRLDILTTLLGALLVAACTTVVPEPAPAPRVVYREMPPPVSEVPAPPPMAGYNWVPGHYAWRGDQWRWQPGYYVQAVVRPMPLVIVEPIPVPPSPRHFYVRGHGLWSGTDWVWVRGHWVEG